MSTMTKERLGTKKVETITGHNNSSTQNDRPKGQTSNDLGGGEWSNLRKKKSTGPPPEKK